MSTPGRQLAELYARVIQEELGLTTIIDDRDCVIFEHPELGQFFIGLNAKMPEYMRLSLPGFFDASQGVSRDDLVQLCNHLNTKANLATLVVHDGDEGYVDAWVGLVFAPAFMPPDEDLVRAVIGSAVQSIKRVVEKFFDVLQRARADAG